MHTNGHQNMSALSSSSIQTISHLPQPDTERRVNTTDAAATQKSDWHLEQVVDGLREARRRWREAHARQHDFGGRELPSPDAVAAIVAALCGALFPMRLGPPDLRHESEDSYVDHALDVALHALLEQVKLELNYTAWRTGLALEDIELRAAGMVRTFAHALPEVRAVLDTDIEAAYVGDPAAHSVDEFCCVIRASWRPFITGWRIRCMPWARRSSRAWWPKSRTQKRASTFTRARRSVPVFSLIMARAWSSARPPSSVSACVCTRW